MQTKGEDGAEPGEEEEEEEEETAEAFEKKKYTAWTAFKKKVDGRLEPHLNKSYVKRDHELYSQIL